MWLGTGCWPDLILKAEYHSSAHSFCVFVVNATGNSFLNTQGFIVALLVTAEIAVTKCPSAGNWLNILCYMHLMENDGSLCTKGQFPAHSTVS